MKFLMIACFSVAALQLAIVITRDLTWIPDDYDEIAVCKIVPTEKFYSSSTPVDREFVTQASEVTFIEVALGKLAAEKASSDFVKDFGWMMFMDHAKANDELRALAQQKGISLPTECGACQQKMNELTKRTGKNFDEKYMEMTVAGHKDVINKFSTHSEQGEDREIRSWAEKQLAVLQYHLSVAETHKP